MRSKLARKERLSVNSWYSYLHTSPLECTPGCTSDMPGEVFVLFDQG